MTTIEKNKMIAEFMGGKYKKADAKNLISERFYDLKDKGYYYLVSELKYNSSWDWIMSVVEKLESLGLQFWIGKYASTVTHERIGNFEINEKGNDKQVVVYNLAYKAIQWHREQPTNNKN